jgi:hypothetical protein
MKPFRVIVGESPRPHKREHDADAHQAGVTAEGR